MNTTPDSFSDGGAHRDPDAAVRRALALLDDGADILDVGAESTRPGAEEVSAREQVERCVRVIAEVVRRRPEAIVSIDTRSAEVARAAIDAGACIVNDVSGLTHDPAMRGLVASSGVPAIVMHMRGTPQDMTERTHYGDVVADVIAELRLRLDEASAAGCRSLLADPGLGFAKTPEQSMALLSATGRIVRELGVPVVVGASRKRFLELVLPPPSSPVPGGLVERDAIPARRRAASAAAAVVAALAGASAVRVHDVAETRDSIRLAEAARAAPGQGQ